MSIGIKRVWNIGFIYRFRHSFALYIIFFWIVLTKHGQYIFKYFPVFSLNLYSLAITFGTDRDFNTSNNVMSLKLPLEDAITNILVILLKKWSYKLFFNFFIYGIHGAFYTQ